MAEKDSDSEDSEDFHNSEEAVMLAKRSAQGDHADDPEWLIAHPPIPDDVSPGPASETRPPSLIAPPFHVSNPL